MAHRSTLEDLALHGVRVLGYATAERIADRYGLDPGTVQESLLDDEARGWVRHQSFAGSTGWSMTDRGRAENERRLAAELDLVGARDAVTAVHAEFLPLNRRFGEVCTAWQIRPTREDPMAFNDHRDWRWDERVLRDLAAVEHAYRGLCGRLADQLARFGRYADLYSAGSTPPTGTPATWSGSSSTRTCSPPSASLAAPNASPQLTVFFTA